MAVSGSDSEGPRQGGGDTPGPDALPARLVALIGILAGHPGGLTGPRLLEASRARWPTLTEARLRKMIADAGPAIVESGGVFRVAALPSPTPSQKPQADGRLRAVSLDLEAIPRLIETAPYIERAVWQVGAVRFGRDGDWVNADRRRVWWVDMPDGFALDDQARVATLASAARAPDEVYTELAAFCADADVLVAYNGTGLDFGEIDDAFDRAGLAPIGLERVDGLYLSYCLWPNRTSHRLKELAVAVGVDVTGLAWHDAADDAEMLARLLEHGASSVVAAWSDELAGLFHSITAASKAWQLAFDLAGRVPVRSAIDDQAVTDVLTGELAAEQPLRPAAAPGGYTIPASWLDASGKVDPYLMSATINPNAVRRQAQQDMADAITARLDPGPDLVVEAPTGTGKSLAALAAALEWLAGDPERKAVIATHTKPLQTQLATDVEALEVAEAGFVPHASIVKGAANRLSLRALVHICTDIASVGRNRRRRVLGDTVFAELVAYLLARLLSHAPGMVGEAESRSVDTADVPAFFDAYSKGRWGGYLSELSQASSGDYADTADLGAHTISVKEHFDSCRLVIANHALVFAHLDALGASADRTLIICDEAHSLEGSATEAFSARLVYQHVEEASRLLSAWAGRPDATVQLRNMAERLAGVLVTEVTAGAAMATVDRIAGPPTSPNHGRVATIASPFSGDVGAAATRKLLSELGRIARFSAGGRKALRGWYHANSAGLSRGERDRYFDLDARLAEISKAAAAVVGDVDVLFGSSYLAGPSARPGSTGGPDGNGAGVDGNGADLDGNEVDNGDLDNVDGDSVFGTEAKAGEGSAEPAEDDLDADRGGSEEGDGEPPQDAPIDDDGDNRNDPTPGDVDGVHDGDGLPGVPLSNRVVWIAEQPGSDLGQGRRHYRFEVASSPIRLTREAGWVQFRSMFARTVFTSATLTTSGNWDYLTDRLGVDDCDKIVLPGPFDYTTQARLFCFSDFPSWAEHTEAAMRSVAHQLVGYGREAVEAGRQPGAMVLTTATATMAGIGEHLASYSAAAGLNIPLAVAQIYGNRRSVEMFRASGGWLVGTKGLWAGVDVPEPDRARIVWINKLPFPPFADPLIAARRAEVAGRAEAEGHPDPDAAGTERYYLPLAAVELRQGVGRLIRSDRHRGVIVVSDRKLSGSTSTRRLYRRVLLESLDPGLHRPDPLTGEATGGNVVTMSEGWQHIWEFLAAGGDIDPTRLSHLCTPAALEEQTLLAETRAIRDAELTQSELTTLEASGALEDEVVSRAAQVAGLLRFQSTPLILKDEQKEAIAAAARGNDLLALLPTGFGKSYCFQLPALVLPGVTIVVSPLVALMADQALELNRAIGGAVRALVTPLRESSSRAGRQEVAEQLTDVADHHIKIVYCSPERFAHRQFRDWVRAGIAAGLVNRIVFDEAHTLVSWGDDFRPSYRRLAVALGDLRAAGGGKLPVSALTATANKAVREGLRAGLFGLPAVPGPQGDPPGFYSISANPVRPELAIYKAALSKAGPVSMSRYIESVFDTVCGLDGHAVFYCLTVREVDALHAHLCDYAGPADRSRIRRFHGRMPEAEKAAVLSDFRDAPQAGEDDFAPMVVVATAAFGLGIDRGDVRCVFVTSPPTDLAALYQQLGRAGRDSTGQIPGNDGPVNAGIALASARGFRTVEFITRDLPAGVLERAGREVLACGGVLDPRRVAERIIDAEVKAGRLPSAVADKDNTRDSYRTAVMRAVAALADLGAVDDLGDMPATLRLTPGETPPPTGPDIADRFAAEARAWVEADPGRAKLASVIEVHNHLAGLGLADPDDPAATWAGLVECHHAGILDTSAAPNRTWLTALAVNTTALPGGYAQRMAARAARAASELSELRDFFAEREECVNQTIADYFAASPPGALPAGTCSTAECRCINCWSAGPRGSPPDLLKAVLAPPAKPASAADDNRRRARLDADIARLLRECFYGLGPRTIWMVLRGNDTYYDRKAGTRRPLRAQLLYHRLFGSRPGVRYAAVSDAIDRLCAAGEIVADGFKWRHIQNMPPEPDDATGPTADPAGVAAGPAPT